MERIYQYKFNTFLGDFLPIIYREIDINNTKKLIIDQMTIINHDYDIMSVIYTNYHFILFLFHFVLTFFFSFHLIYFKSLLRKLIHIRDMFIKNINFFLRIL